MIIESNEAYKRVLEYSESITRKYITFFTPTFNRSKYLNRVYDCLLKQSNSQFVWIIVNDGSKDETTAVAADIINEDRIPVLYIEKENGGKHSAFQVALNYTITGYFVCMDDDDVYSKNSVSFFLSQWEVLENDHSIGIGAIRVLSKKADGSIVCNIPIQENPGVCWDLSTLDCFYKKHIIFENWTCYQTAALREIDIFPKNYWLSEKHRFFAEGIWQGRFARKYKCRYIMVSLREYREELGDSLMKSALSPARYLDVFINKKMILDEQFDYFWYYPLWFLRQIIIVSLLRKYLSIRLFELLHNTKHRSLRTLYVISSPVSFFSRTLLKKKI